MKIILCGDMAVTPESVRNFENCDAKGAFGDVIDVFKTGDRVFVNLECALTESDVNLRKIGPCIKGPKNTAKTLKDAGVTDCFLSNNHIFDFCKKGLEDTIKTLRECGLGYTGIGKNYEDSRKDYIIEAEGMKIAIINVCEHEYSYALENRVGARPFDEFETMHDIREAKKENDYVIVVYHGGKEYCRYPSPRLLKACREMARCGADAVFCQHSHIIGCYEKFEGCHIVYGQGNFHFVEIAEGESYNEGLMADLDITKEGIDIKFIPVVAEGEGIVLAKGERAEKILSDMKKRDAEILSGEWKAGWSKFCEGVFEKYQAARKGEFVEAPGDERQMFSHYLDCEAHRDVWQELFKTWNHTNEI